MTGKELKIKRITAGMTQWDLAMDVGIQPARISEMENGLRAIAGKVIQAIDRQLAEQVQAP